MRFACHMAMMVMQIEGAKAHGGHMHYRSAELKLWESKPGIATWREGRFFLD